MNLLVHGGLQVLGLLAKFIAQTIVIRSVPTKLMNPCLSDAFGVGSVVSLIRFFLLNLIDFDKI